jgi:N-methylhydantoinase B
VNRYRFLRGSDVHARLEASALPRDIDELAGTEETLQLRQQNFVQRPADVYAVLWSAAAGFGDPLERDPERVAADVEQETVSPQMAVKTYGVVLDSNGGADRAGTERKRAEIRRQRLAGAAPPAASRGRCEGPVSYRPSENLEIRRTAQGDRFCCVGCATDLGSARANYKLGCARNDAPIEDANPIVGDPARYIDVRPVFRQFFCPGCGRLIENEVALADDPILHDIELAV